MKTLPFASLLPVPLSKPAVRVGAIDATHDRVKPTPRSLDEAFGPYGRRGQVVPMDTPAPMHRADRIVYRASLLGLVALVAMHFAGWLS